MSHLACLVIAGGPTGEWIAALIDTWNTVRDAVEAPDWRWEATTHPRGEPMGEEERRALASEGDWRRLLEEMARGEHSFIRAIAMPPSKRAIRTGSDQREIAGLVLEAWLYHVLQPGGLGDPLSRIIFAGLPARVESDRRGAVLVAVNTERDDGERRVRDVVVAAAERLFVATRARWAQVGVYPRAPNGPWLQVGVLSGGIVAERAAREVPEIAWSVILGEGHVAALGGETEAERILAPFSPRRLGQPGGHGGLRVTAAPDPVPPDAEPVAELRRALAPLLLTPPPFPAQSFLLVTEEARRAVTLPPTLPVRTLGDGTIEVVVSERPIPADDRAGQDELERSMQAVYAAIPMRFFRGPKGPWAENLSLPRLLGERTLMRVGTTDRPAGLPVRDTGEPLGDELPLHLVAERPPPESWRGGVQQVVSVWGARCGCDPRITWTGGHGTFHVPTAAARRHLLALLLAIDRAALVRKTPAIAGVVVGAWVPPDELARRWRVGEPLARYGS